jgi:hypothetical protein
MRGYELAIALNKNGNNDLDKPNLNFSLPLDPPLGAKPISRRWAEVTCGHVRSILRISAAKPTGRPLHFISICRRQNEWRLVAPLAVIHNEFHLV